MDGKWSVVALGTARHTATQGSADRAAPAQADIQQAQADVQQAQADARQAQADAREAARDAAQQARDAAQQARDAIREAARQAARAGRNGQPSVYVGQFPPFEPRIPQEAVMISVAFFVMCAVIAIGVPIARAIARRMDRKGITAPGTDAETRSRLERIEQALDAVALEVERISEGQRFTTKVLSDLRAMPGPDAAPARRLGGT